MKCIKCNNTIKFKKVNYWICYSCCDLLYKIYNYNNISISLEDNLNNISITYILYPLQNSHSLKRITIYQNERDAEPIINDLINIKSKINIYYSLKQDYDYCLKYIDNLVFL